MKILYLYAHPAVDSFNQTLKNAGIEILRKKKHQVIISDLYANQFNPVAAMSDFQLPDNELNPQYFISQKMASEQHAFAEDIQTEMDKLVQADHLLLQFPLWWFAAPAMLKGWMDRVLAKGFAYDANKTFDNGLLRGKSASVVVTTQSPESAYKINGVHHAALEDFLLPIYHTLKFTGIQIKNPFVVYGAIDINNERRESILNNFEYYLTQEIKNEN